MTTGASSGLEAVVTEQRLDDLLLALQRQRPRAENEQVSWLAALAFAEHVQAVVGLVLRVDVGVLLVVRFQERTAAVAERRDVLLHKWGPGLVPETAFDALVVVKLNELPRGD